MVSQRIGVFKAIYVIRWLVINSLGSALNNGDLELSIGL